MLVTALAPAIGYDEAAAIAKDAHKRGHDLARGGGRQRQGQRRGLRPAGAAGGHARAEAADAAIDAMRQQRWPCHRSAIELTSKLHCRFLPRRRTTDGEPIMTKLRARLSTSAAAIAIALLFPQTAAAQDGNSAAEGEPEQPQTSSQIVVQADIGYRNRSDDAAEPVLIYDEEYFQRFEPLTAGDALKRVPSVTFLSDVIESDGPRLRGLDPGYTQILINGERVPGPDADRSFFLDRIPAELIERVEIVRSSSARRTGDAVAGTINIVLRDAFTLDGGYVKGGGAAVRRRRAQADRAASTTAARSGRAACCSAPTCRAATTRRRSVSFRYGDSPENNPTTRPRSSTTARTRATRATARTTRSTRSWGIDGSDDRFRDQRQLGAHRPHRDRAQLRVQRRDRRFGPVAARTTTTRAADRQRQCRRDRPGELGDRGKLAHEWSLGETTLRAGFARFDDDRDEIETEVAFDTDEGDDPEWESALVLSRIKRRGARPSSSTTSSRCRWTSTSWSAASGRTRTATPTSPKASRTASSTIATGTSSAIRRPTSSAVRGVRDRSPAASTTSSETARRPASRWSRASTARSSGKPACAGRTPTSRSPTSPRRRRWRGPRTTTTSSCRRPRSSTTIGDGRITASVARTLRRPQFDYLSPALLEEEVGDNDFLGNPAARAGDRLGRRPRLRAPHRPHRRGRRQRVLPQGRATWSSWLPCSTPRRPVRARRRTRTTTTSSPSYSSRRTSATARSTASSSTFRPTSASSACPTPASSATCRWLDSEVDRRFGERRFNDQSEYVYNFGFIQNLREFGAAFGATYRKQGSAYRPGDRRGSDHHLRRRPRDLRREALRRQLHDPRGRLEPARRQEARDVQQVRHDRGPDRTATSTSTNSRPRRPGRCSSSSAGTRSDARPDRSAALAACLLPACATTRRRACRRSRSPPSRRPSRSAPPPQDAADDPAIWRNAADPAASLIVATDKKAGLYVYGLDGRTRSFADGGLLNNVDLADMGAAGVIVVASDRNDLGQRHAARSTGSIPARRR